ncbi:bifunctional metallophosphatase/5'-nucleotidase [Staphylococcus condimenti]|uniref:Bifunctional metallophosphatase/5'-nucleotidase n=1 Tax=Staphylococcus condimenti TaxID=70255 RepID=A0A4Q7CP61_9STAP|nr:MULTISPECIES: 5'-nucleotidase C-terminal domain-containing protein [Staphylococcus]MDK8645449.1 5'-nucleotidase C-terminal domain-containing protein [Staphylococcus condimenti]OFP03894.1 bifunctional metallophosphatase/5'-nucleotidase [Staphylococcus sp. HMSC065E08]RZI02036.1 bifunctional metallophosphatase/5'-nucleotidase [Staphylococcus condimenti]RZI04835.1 bifunctional metallophosphatase/5'-nucleotidase [Staphylococcus condimenti]
MHKALLKTLFFVIAFFVLFHVSAFAAETPVKPANQATVENTVEPAQQNTVQTAATADSKSNTDSAQTGTSDGQSVVTPSAPSTTSSEALPAASDNKGTQTATADTANPANADKGVPTEDNNALSQKKNTVATQTKAVPQPSQQTVKTQSAPATEQPQVQQLSAPAPQQSAAPQTQAVEPSAQTQQAPQQAKILHTNDMHGRILGEDGRVIGMSKLKAIKEQENPDLMLDSGDAFQGLPISNNTKGADMAKAMNSVGYDAMAVGNHEFDFGLDQAMKYKDQLNFPILSANTYKDNKLLFDPYTIVKKNGIRYGIVGVTTPETAVKTHPDNIKGVTFTEPIPAVQNILNQINNQADVFIVLSHLGVDPSTQTAWRGDTLANTLAQDPRFKDKEIFVLDGHSHTVIQNGKINQNTLLAQTGTALENIGEITFDYANGKVENVQDSLINVKDTADVQPDAELQKMMDEAKAKFDDQVSEVVIPNNPVQFEGERDDVRSHETNLGNAITDAMEAYSQNGFSHPADFAVTNGGGIRASIDKGKDVTLGDIITVLPFGNTISQIQVKGTNVQKMFEHSLSAPVQDGKLGANGGFLHISKSIRVYYDMNKEPGSRVLKIEVLNKKTNQFEALDPERTYYMTTNDFTASGGDGYDMLGGPREEGVSLDKVFADYLKQADLSQYASNDISRIINGNPPVSETEEKPESNTANSETSNTTEDTNVDSPKNNPINIPNEAAVGENVVSNNGSSSLAEDSKLVSHKHTDMATDNVMVNNNTTLDQSETMYTNLSGNVNKEIDTNVYSDISNQSHVQTANTQYYDMSDIKQTNKLSDNETKITESANQAQQYISNNKVIAFPSQQKEHKNSELPNSGHSEPHNSPIVPMSLILLGAGTLYYNRKKDKAA